jgi:glutamyl/glutaminyl-tRNA synthetase
MIGQGNELRRSASAQAHKLEREASALATEAQRLDAAARLYREAALVGLHDTETPVDSSENLDPNTAYSAQLADQAKALREEATLRAEALEEEARQKHSQASPLREAARQLHATSQPGKPTPPARRSGRREDTMDPDADFRPAEYWDM